MGESATLGDGDGAGDGVADGVADGVGEGVGEGEGDADGVGVDTATFTATPLPHSNFPDFLIHVYLKPLYVVVKPTLLHLVPSLGVAACEIEIKPIKSATEIRTALKRKVIPNSIRQTELLVLA